MQKPLQLNRTLFVFCGMCSSNRSTFSENAQTLGAIVLMFFCTLIPGYRYFIEHTDDLPDALGAFLMTIASTIMVGDAIGMVSKRKIALKFFEQLNQIVQKSNFKQMQFYFQNRNKKIMFLHRINWAIKNNF